MKETTRKWLRACCGGIFVVAVGSLAFYFGKEYEAKKGYDAIRQEVIVPEEHTKPVEQLVKIPIDFRKLQEKNPDIYAWIQIPGTVIDYPVLQHPTDNKYYLNHTAEGDAHPMGAIYSEFQTAKDFEDFNTVLYGHNMPNGTMFRGLHKFKEMDYLKDHSKVIIYTPYAQYTYEIYAAVVYDDIHILNGFDYTKPENRQAFIDSLQQARNMGNSVRDDVLVTPNDRLLTLSTCIKTQRDKRMIVGAVLVDEKKADRSHQ